MTIYGWDGSHYDWDRGPMDLVGAKAAGISFMTHKIGEGTSYTDPKFATFHKRARAAGIGLLGAYYVNHHGDQNAQADRFLALLDAQAPGWRNGPFLLQIDAERWADGEPTPAEVEAFAHRLMAKAPDHTPVIYGPKWVYGDRLKGAGVPLWASNYGNNPDETFKAAYPGDTSDRWGAYSGMTPAILQYGSKTKIGTQPTCDANAYRGSLDHLISLCYHGDDVTPEQLQAACEAAIQANIDNIAAFVWHSPQFTPTLDAAGKPVVPTHYTESGSARLDRLDKLAALVVGDKEITNDDLKRIAAAVWGQDGTIPAAAPPVANADYASNPDWTASYGVYTTVDNVRRARQELADAMKEIRALVAGAGADPNLADTVARKVDALIAARYAS